MTDHHSMPSKNYKEEKSREPIFVIQSEPAGETAGWVRPLQFHSKQLKGSSPFFLIFPCVTLVTGTEEDCRDTWNQVRRE